MQSTTDMKRKWIWAVEWLHEELERRPYAPNAQYGYNNWSPPAQSNETSSGYFLERSNSARMILGKALELCPEEEAECDDVSEEGESPPPDDVIKSPPSYPKVTIQTTNTPTTTPQESFGLPTSEAPTTTTTSITSTSLPPITVGIPAEEQTTSTTDTNTTTTTTENNTLKTEP